MSEPAPAIQEPRTSSQWRWVMNYAEAMLQLDACKQYGLIEGGPKVNPDRCRELLERGAALGHKSSKKGVTQALHQIVAQFAKPPGVPDGEETEE